jgi:hypothetical protein
MKLIDTKTVELMGKLSHLKDQEHTTIMKQSWRLEYNATKRRLQRRGVAIFEDTYDIKFGIMED